MDTAPIYELRERLRAAAIAGTNLLSENFRLRRAYEAFKPLESVSPVFAKIGQLTEQLLSPKCQNTQGILLDTMSLADAVICTLGTVDIKGEVVPIDTINVGETAVNTIVNAPCSKIKALIEALTTSGSGNYSLVSDMHISNPEIFRDYRVRDAMIWALGASYAELAEMVKEWLGNEGETVIPLLKKGFDPKGKKNMVRRLQVIKKIAGAAENDFYIEMLKTATGEVRLELIEALRFEPSNTELLFDMQKTEKGKNKQAVQNMLALVEDERCYELFHAIAVKNPAEACENLFISTTDSASRVIAELCEQQLAGIIALPQSEWGSAETDKKMELFCRQTVEALIGKHGDAVCACYRELLLHADVLENAGRWKIRSDILEFSWKTTRTVVYYANYIQLNGLGDYRFPVRSREFSWELVLGSLMAQSLVVYPDDDLKKMALELYENSTDNNKNINFLTAATVAKILGQEDCIGWLDENAVGQSELDEMERAFVCFMWNREQKSYVVDMECAHGYDHKSCKTIFHTVQIPHAKKITDWMMRHNGKQTDAIINRWIDTTDAEECEKYGRYFYERASRIVHNEEYLRYMRNCGWKQCKGLGTDYAKINVRREDNQWRLNEYLHNMPGDAQALLEETSAVADLVRSGEVELQDLREPEDIENWANHLKDLKVYNALRDDR